MTDNYNIPYINFAVAMLEQAIEGAKKGNIFDMLWLLSDDGNYYIELFDLPREFYVKVVADAIRENRS